MLSRARGRLRSLEQAIWTRGEGRAPGAHPVAVRAARLVIVVLRDVFRGDLTLWTMSLVYTSLLSMVPLLALSFSVLKAFGVHNQVEPLLENLLAPLGADSVKITSRIIGFIERMNVGVLGAVGLALLLYTVVSLLQKVEEAFNALWHVTEVRSFGQRVSRYLSVLFVGPMLVFAALGVTALALESPLARDLLATPPFGALAGLVGTLLPYLLVVGAFAFIYRFVPNTRVPFVPALGGALVGGILWQSAGWGFAAFIATSTQYAAIYSSFAILVLFLIWLYVSWLVLLVGADVSFYLAHPEYLFALPGEPRLSNRMRERLALAVMHEVGRRFLRGDPPATVHALTRVLAVPMYMVRVVLDALVAAGFLARSGGDPPAFLPARALDGVSVAEVLAVVRAAGEERFLDPAALPLAPSVEAMMARVEQAMDDAAASTSIEAMIRTGAVEGTFPAERAATGSD